MVRIQRLNCVHHRRELGRKLRDLRRKLLPQTLDEGTLFGLRGKKLGQNAIKVLVVDLRMLTLALFSLRGCSGRVGLDFAVFAHVLGDLVRRIRDVNLCQDRDYVRGDPPARGGFSSAMKS